MKESHNKLESNQLLKDIRENIKIINCIDITDEFGYEDVFVYDCMLETSRVHLATIDFSGNVSYMTMNDYPMFENDIRDFIGSIISILDSEIRIKYSIDTVKVDYDIYTFFDYKENIKFILTVDVSGQNRRYLKLKAKNIISTQLRGKSKYLN